MKKSFIEASNLIKQFKWNSLLVKYFRTFFLILILPISILNIFIYTSLQSGTRKDIENFAFQSNSIVVNTLNTALNSFYNDYLYYTDDASVFRYLSADEKTVTSIDFFQYIADIRSKMILHTQSSPYLNSIYLYSFKNNYIISNSSGNPVDYFYDTAWLDHYNKTKKSYYISPQITEFDDHISVCYELSDHSGTMGIIVFNLDLQSFRKTIRSDANSSIASIGLYNEDNDLVFSIGEALDQALDVEKISSDFDDYIKSDSKYMHIFTRLEQSNELMQVSLKTELLSSQRSRAIMYLLLGFLLSLAIAGLLSLYFAFKFYESISNIIIEINDKTSENLPSANNNSKNFDELSFISQNISKLLFKHSRLEDELYQSISNLKRMQLMTLQSQLNPHFLFNTLNHISILTMDSGENGELANQIICNLSALLRISLGSKEYILDIKTELSYAEKYIEIERIKYKDKFDVVWDIDESVLNCAAAKFMLQPIIENAFIHGIHKAKKDTKSVLSISVHPVNKNIVFKIFNTGAKIDEDKLSELMQQLAVNDLPDSEHIGLCNVHQRIKLMFGEAYGISQITSDSTGTTVEITIPNQPYK